MNGNNKIFAVIDTNVVVSAFFSRNGRSNPALIIEKILDNIIIPLYNDEILSEYFEVLSHPVFPFKKDQITRIISAFRKYGVSTERTPVTDESFPDQDDIVFYEITMSVEDAYLVTGNIKHFPRKPFVVTPAEMIAILGG